MITGREGACGLMPAGEGLLQWWFDVPWSPTDGLPATPLADLRRRFGRWASPVPEVLAAASEDDLGFFRHHWNKVRQVWGEGRITLVGDAAHMMPPTLGQAPTRPSRTRGYSAASSPATATIRQYACAPTRRPATRTYLWFPGWPGAILPTGVSRRYLAGCSPKRSRPPCSPATATALPRRPRNPCDRSPARHRTSRRLPRPDDSNHDKGDFRHA
jgi:hypothetical protein